MKEGKDKKKSKFNNRLLYTLISFGILLIIAGGIYAVDTTQAWHSASQVDFTQGIVLPADSPAATAGQIRSTGIIKFADGSAAQGIYAKQIRLSGSWATNDANDPGIGGIFASGNIQSSGTISTSKGINAGEGISSSTYIHANTGSNSNLASTFYNLAGTHIGGQTIYAYDKLCVGNSAGSCDGTGGTVITSADVTSGAFYYSSDLKLKENVLPLTNSLEIVKQLQGVSFNWKDTGRTDIGLIAQDVEKILPELVHTNKEGLKSVEYGNIVAILVEAIKDQQKQIDELKVRLGE